MPQDVYRWRISFRNRIKCNPVIWLERELPPKDFIEKTALTCIIDHGGKNEK